MAGSILETIILTDYATKITALEDALASGELTVEADGDRVTYRSVKELRSALDYMKTQQAAALTSTQRPASTVAAYDPT